MLFVLIITQIKILLLTLLQKATVLRSHDHGNVVS